MSDDITKSIHEKLLAAYDAETGTTLTPQEVERLLAWLGDIVILEQKLDQARQAIRDRDEVGRRPR